MATPELKEVIGNRLYFNTTLIIRLTFNNMVYYEKMNYTKIRRHAKVAKKRARAQNLILTKIAISRIVLRPTLICAQANKKL